MTRQEAESLRRSGHEQEEATERVRAALRGWCDSDLPFECDQVFVTILAKMGYDVHVALRVVQQNEHAMKYVPQMMQGDCELCAAVVAQNW